MSDLPNIFANNPLDRATHYRIEPDWLVGAQKQGLVLPFWRGQIFMPTPQRLGFVRDGLVSADKKIGMIFLGIDQKRIPYWACPMSDYEDPSQKELKGLGQFSDLRLMASTQNLSADDLAICAQARGLIEWHLNHIFCANCGGETKPIEAGHKRLCPLCVKEHFPRIDPVVIMMIHHQGKGFLGRQKEWPPQFYSALAGFVEAGESIEEAIKRESWEEAKIDIVTSQYHSTQPWPWPYSLMIGCLAEAKNEDFQIDGVELETGAWFDRNQLKKALRDEDDFLKLPPPMAIAHRLIHAFVSLGD